MSRHNFERDRPAAARGQGMNQVHRWRAFAVLAVSFFMTVADLAIVNVALPTIGRKLHMPESSLQWVVTGYALTFGGFLLLGGRAADLLGRRRILMAGLAVFTAASLGCGLATTDVVADPDARPAGTGRGGGASGGAVDRDEHVPRRRRAEQGAGRVGRDRGQRRDGRGDRRRAADPLRRLAVHLLPQRADRRRGAAARPASRAGEPAGHRPPALRPASARSP